jgi:hypothetical protein
VCQHPPEPADRRRWHGAAERRQISLDEAAHEVGAPLQAALIIAREIRVRKAAALPQPLQPEAALPVQLLQVEAAAMSW